MFRSLWTAPCNWSAAEEMVVCVFSLPSVKLKHIVTQMWIREPSSIPCQCKFSSVYCFIFQEMRFCYVSQADSLLLGSSSWATGARHHTTHKLNTWSFILIFCIAGDRTQGLLHAQQVLYKLLAVFSQNDSTWKACIHQKAWEARYSQLWGLYVSWPRLCSGASSSHSCCNGRLTNANFPFLYGA